MSVGGTTIEGAIPRGCAALLLALLAAGAGCLRGGFTAPVDSAWPEASSDGGERPADADAAASWQPLGGSATGHGITGWPGRPNNLTLVAGHGGALYHAWTDAHTGNAEVYLRRWDGTSWGSLGGSAAPGGISRTPGTSRLGGLAVDDEGRPLVSWKELDPSGAYLRRWDGTSWAELGGSATGGGVSGGGNPWWPAVALLDGVWPLVAWEQYNVEPTGGVIHLRAWDGTSWAELDGSATSWGVGAPDSSAYHVSIVTAAGARVHAVWREQHAGGIRVRYRHFDGSQWLPLGAPLSPATGEAGAPRIAVDAADRPIVCWDHGPAGGERSIQLLWAGDATGSTWHQLGGSADPAGLSAGITDSAHPTIAYLPQEQRVAVAWDAEDALGRNIYLRRWDGTAWRGVAGSADPGGVSRSAASSTYPRAALLDQRLVVVWEEVQSPDQGAAYGLAWP